MIQGMELPKTRIKAEYKSPKISIIYSKPKSGKTTAVSLIENNLILDLENGSDFVDAIKIKANSAEDIRLIGEEILKQEKPYRYITVDTITALEDIALPVALNMYKSTPMGKTFKDANILNLPNGGGYYWLRQAMEALMNYIETLAPRIIYLGHLKDKLLNTDGKEVNSSDLDLTGKMRNIVCSRADAIGMLKREKNQTILSFKTSDIVNCGARPEYLRNKEIVLLESDDSGSIVKNGWNSIFID